MSAAKAALRWSEASDAVEAALNSSARHEIVSRLAEEKTPLAALRAAMKRHTLATGSGSLVFQRIVASLDARSRQEGLHLVQAWDFGKHVFTDDSTPVLLLDYCMRLPSRRSDDRAAMALLLDQYFLTVLSLLAVRAWDEGDANANLDRVSELLRVLQGPGGSGHTFIDDAGSLLFLAISYFHPEEIAYDRLLAKVEALDGRLQLSVAKGCAGMMSQHLRWGLRFMYGRDVGRMRDDNVADYSWLSHAVTTLAREYARLREGAATEAQRLEVAEALMLGLAADPWAFSGVCPPILKGREADHAAVRAVLEAHKDALIADFECLRPSPSSFSPLGFTCNFPTNTAVAMVAVSLEDARSYPPLNALESSRRDPAATQQLATRLMDYAVSDPSRLGAGQAPLIAYDPFEGASAFNTLQRSLRASPT